jgi:hypothetical protein
MKTKIIAAVILIAASLTILYSFKAQQGSEEQADFAVMRVYEAYDTKISSDKTLHGSGIVLSYSNGKTEPVYLLNPLTVHYALKNLPIINSYLLRMKKEGYKLKSTSGGEQITTYIFEKE